MAGEQFLNPATKTPAVRGEHKKNGRRIL